MATPSQIREPTRTLRDSLRLVAGDSLCGYERPNGQRVAEITLAMATSDTLLNPIVADSRRELLIDGHHRREALRWSGIELVPIFDVAYLSRQVDVRGWNRVTFAPASVVRAVFHLLKTPARGSWRVVAEHSIAGIIAECRAEAGRPAAVTLDRICLLISETGHRVSITPHEHANAGDSHAPHVDIYMDPIISREEVLSAAEDGAPFPHQVNRHVVDRRPIDMRIPLDSLTGEQAFSDFLDAALLDRPPRLVAGATWFDGRFYEERTTQFGAGIARR